MRDRVFKIQVKQIFVALILVCVLSACEAAKIESIQGQVILNPKQTFNTVPVKLFGQNIQWTQGGDGFILSHDPNAKRWNTALIDASDELNIPLLRFPGGELANTFQWRDSIGAFAKRKPGLNFAGNSENYLFGVDEFIELCQKISTKAVVTLNLNSPDKELFGLIDYFRRHPQCPVEYWELGNEVYAHGTSGSMTVEQYAKRVRSLSKKLRARYRSIKLGAVFELSFQEAAWMKNVFPSLLTWNQTLIEKVATHIDFAVIHFYAPFDKDLFRTTENRLLLSSPEVFERSFIEFKKLMNKHNSNMRYGVTEFNSFFGSKLFVSKNVSSTVSALYNSILIAKFAELDVDFANYWSLVNNGEFGMIEARDETLNYGAFYPLWRQLRQFSGAKRIQSQIDYEGRQQLIYSVQAKGNVPNDDDLSALTSFAVRHASGKYQLMIINRSQNYDVSLEVSSVGERLSVKSGTQFQSQSDYRAWKKTILGAGQNNISLPPLSAVFVELVLEK